jgi:hypothetical protein
VQAYHQGIGRRDLGADLSEDLRELVVTLHGVETTEHSHYGNAGRNAILVAEAQAKFGIGFEPIGVDAIGDDDQSVRWIALGRMVGGACV